MKTAFIKSIEIKSLRERFLLHEEFFNNEVKVNYSPYDGTDHFDATWEDEGVKYITEAKVRGESKGFGEFMIQKDKYDYLMSRANEFDKVYYINFFGDGILVWDLKQIEEPQWKEMTGQQDNFNDIVKMKPAADLYTHQCVKVIDKNINTFKAMVKAEDEWLKRNKGWKS